MENKPTVLLIEDELSEYTNWKKWLNLANIETNLVYASDLDSAIEEIKKQVIDIYIIDLHLSTGNVLNFLSLIRNKKGLKIALTESVDNINYLEKLYELGAIPITKNQNIHDPMRVVELIFSLHDLGEDSDEVILSDELKTQILQDVSVKLEKLSDQVTELKLNFQNILDEVATMRVYILGDYNSGGIKTKLEIIEEDIKELKSDNTNHFVQEILDVYKSSPLYLKLIILSFISLLLVTLPLVLIHKIIGS